MPALATTAPALDRLHRGPGALSTPPRPRAAFVDGAFAFHVAIAEGCGNALIAGILGAIVELTDATRDPVHFRAPEASALTMKEHARIARCVAERDSDGAARAMESHLLRAFISMF